MLATKHRTKAATRFTKPRLPAASALTLLYAFWFLSVSAWAQTFCAWNAGSPSSLKERGPYTHQFEAFSYIGDVIERSQQGGAVSRASFIESPAKDPFGQPIYRMRTQYLGDANDHTSSDDGGSVQGMISYRYGAMEHARMGTNFGVDARTDHITDARGNTTAHTQYYTDVLRDDIWLFPPFWGADYSVHGGNRGNNHTYNFSYDGRGWLSGETRCVMAGAVPYNGASVYTYDAAGNLNGGVNGWQYDNANRVTYAPAVAGHPGATLARGSGGYVTQLNNKTLAYDVWGRLSQVDITDPADPWTLLKTIQYGYDPLGRRASRVERDASGVVVGVTYFDYDGDTLIGDEQANGSGFASLSPVVKPAPLFAASFPAFGEPSDWWATLGSGSGGGGPGTVDIADVSGLVLNRRFVPLWTLGTVAPTFAGKAVVQQGSGTTYRSYVVGADGYVGVTSGGGNTYYQYNAQGHTLVEYATPGTMLWQLQHGFDASGNVQEGPTGAGAPSPYPSSSPMVTNGGYRDPDTGIIAPAGGGLAGSYSPELGDRFS